MNTCKIAQVLIQNSEDVLYIGNGRGTWALDWMVYSTWMNILFHSQNHPLINHRVTTIPPPPPPPPPPHTHTHTPHPPMNYKIIKRDSVQIGHMRYRIFIGILWWKILLRFVYLLFSGETNKEEMKEESHDNHEARHQLTKMNLFWYGTSCSDKLKNTRIPSSSLLLTYLNTASRKWEVIVWMTDSIDNVA